MTALHDPFRTLKRLAIKLLRDVKSDSALRSLPVVRRLSAAGLFPEHSAASLYNRRHSVQLKHIHTLLAREKGHPSWEALVRAPAEATPDPALLFEEALSEKFGPFLNLWFASYEEAKSWQQEHGGYLLQYKQQFVVCKDEQIQSLGWDPLDPNWQAIDYDTARPTNPTALHELSQRKRPQIR